MDLIQKKSKNTNKEKRSIKEKTREKSRKSTENKIWQIIPQIFIIDKNMRIRYNKKGAFRRHIQKRSEKLLRV